MKRADFIVSLLMTFIAIPALAAERAPAEKPGQAAKSSRAGATGSLSASAPSGSPAAISAPADKQPVPPTAPLIPKRELRFDLSEEEQPVELFAADPRLLELRYVGTFRLQLRTERPFPSYFFDISKVASEWAGVWSQLERRYRTLQTQNPWYAVFLDDIPAGQLPPKDIVAALTTQENCRVLCKRVGFAARDREEVSGTLAILEFRVLAPTAEKAKELVGGMLSLYDYGLIYPKQQELLREKDFFQERLAERRPDISKAQEEIKGLQEQLEKLKEFEGISPETLSGLITQQRLISVDTDGVKARIDACNTLLKRIPREDSNRWEQIEGLRVAAQVELAGLEARRDSMKEIVDKARQHRDLIGKVAAKNRGLGIAQRVIRDYEGDISKVEEYQTNAVPFPVENNEVNIRRIKWEPVKKEADKAK
jgi:hypothetical protein